MYVYIYKCMMHQDDEIKNVNKRKVKKKKEQKRDVYYCVWILTLKYIYNVFMKRRGEYIKNSLMRGEYIYHIRIIMKICQCNLKKKSV